jgi:DNA-binding MarR family transcriptional regulator
MTSKTKPLSDLHYVLLAIAAKRTNGSILPPFTSLGVTRAGLTRAITALIKRGYAQEIESDDEASLWRREGTRQLAAVITDAGRAAVAEAHGKKVEEQNPTVGEAVSPVSRPDKPKTKQALLIDMLQRQEGTTLAQLVEVTAWLPHTTRAALTGLRKKGHAITNERIAGVSHYRIVTAA